MSAHGLNGNFERYRTWETTYDNEFSSSQSLREVAIAFYSRINSKESSIPKEELCIQILLQDK